MSDSKLIDEGVSSVDLRISNIIYNLDTIKKTAYRFAGEASFDFRIDGNDVVCKINFSQPKQSDELNKFQESFNLELLDQDLRHQVALETASLRNAILAYAFSKTGLQESE
jgi:His-Xaa-Ser system protein HxsD